jgi:hypothetical protein
MGMENDIPNRKKSGNISRMTYAFFLNQGTSFGGISPKSNGRVQACSLRHCE